jgi:dimethyladenosine transferase 1, mitochondrial
LIKLYSLSARQDLSQNFILDLNLTDKIVRASCGDIRECTVVEVGAGPGSLTRSLLKRGARQVIAVEKDERFLPSLRLLQRASQGRMRIVLADMLDVDEVDLVRCNADTINFVDDPDFVDYDLSVPDAVNFDDERERENENEDERCRVQLLGNLPFSVATPLLLKWLRCAVERRGLFEFGRVPMSLMFQKEVADRIVAGDDSSSAKSSKDYSRLSVMTQFCARAHRVMHVGSKSFVPPPKVDATVVRIVPRAHTMDPTLPCYDEFETVVRLGFQQRRKQLAKALRPLAAATLAVGNASSSSSSSSSQASAAAALHARVSQFIAEARLDEAARPEQITVEQWAALTHVYHRLMVAARRTAEW